MKRCWICGKTERGIKKVYDIDQQIKDKAVWIENRGAWFHDLCCVCNDLILNLVVPDFVLEEMLEGKVNDIIDKRIMHILNFDLREKNEL